MMMAYTGLQAKDKSSAFSPFRMEAPDQTSCPAPPMRYPMAGYYSTHSPATYHFPYSACLGATQQYFHPDMGYIPFRDATKSLLPHPGSFLQSSRLPGVFGYHTAEEEKPSQSYIGLIGKAIMSTPQKKLVLSDIYNYILGHYPYFRNKGPGWRNSIRHNLSLNECFVKVGRSPNGKGHFWAINPSNYEDFSKGEYRRKRASKSKRSSSSSSSSDNSTKTGCDMKKSKEKHLQSRTTEQKEGKELEKKAENTGLLTIKLNSYPKPSELVKPVENRGFHIETLLSGIRSDLPRPRTSL